MISVIMSTYKESEKFLRESIESILQQTYQDFEFIIILDYPENQEHIRIINEYKEKDSRIQFYINEKNKGLTDSLNTALTYIRGEYVARMDADDIACKDRFEKQIKYLQENDYDLIGGITRMINEDGKTLYSISKVPSDYNKIKKIIRYNQCIAHPTWLGKKEVFDNLNGYRKMPLCEDYDFTLRAILKGYRISNLNETVLNYRMTSQSISRSNLFNQFLYMKYITNEYKNGKIAEIDDAEKYVTSKFTEKKSKRYLKANKYFNDMLYCLEHKKMICFIMNGFKMVFTSKNFMEKIYRFVMVSLYS